MRHDRTSGRGHRPQDDQLQRYRSLDQAGVNRRAQRLLVQMLTPCQLTQRMVRDVPWGSRRCVPLAVRPCPGAALWRPCL
jgi:hypothetical protein